MDVDRAFWQDGVAEEDKRKTAFTVDGRLLLFLFEIKIKNI